MVFIPWRPLPSSHQIRKVNNFTEGLDTETSPFFVDENALVDGYGWGFDEYPALKVRKGRTTHGSSGGATTRLLTNFGNTHLVRAVGTKLQYNSSGTTWSDITGTFTDSDWDAANFDIGGPALILTNGTDVAQYWNGTALAAISAMPKGKYVAADNLRVYTAGVSGSLDEISYCAFLDATDWTGDGSGTVQYYTANGGPITALHAFAGNIWAFKKDSFAVIYTTGDSRMTHRLVIMSTSIGCVSYKTVKEVGPYLMWLGEETVYIGAGDAAKDIGHPIRRYLDNMNRSALSNAFAFSDSEQYYLCIPTGNNTQPDTCLVYNYLYKKWLPYSITLGSLRFGATLNNITYAGDANGQTFKMNDGLSDAGVAIPWRVVSRPFDDGMKEAEKELWEMHLQGYFPSGSTLSVEVAPDDIGSTWYNIDYDPISASNATVNKNLIVPLDSMPLVNFYTYRLSGTGPATIQEVQRYSRIQPVQY